MKLKELRIKHKKSQIEVAKSIGISQRSYSTYEINQNEPTIETLIKLADYFDVTLDYLVDRPYSNTFGYLSDDEKKLIANFREMSKTNQAKLVSQSEGILLAEKE